MKDKVMKIFAINIKKGKIKLCFFNKIFFYTWIRSLPLHRSFDSMNQKLNLLNAIIVRYIDFIYKNLVYRNK